MYETRYAVVYKNEDGSYSTGKWLHRHQWCAVDGIPEGETRPVVCLAEVRVFKLEPTDPVMTGYELREIWADEIKERKAEWEMNSCATQQMN